MQAYLWNALLVAYPRIRQYAQQARDEARKIIIGKDIKDYNIWIVELDEKYNRVLDSLHNNIFLLEHFNHYHYVHSYKNTLLEFYHEAQNLNLIQKLKLKLKRKPKLLEDEYNNLLKKYELVVYHIKLKNDDLNTLELKTDE